MAECLSDGPERCNQTCFSTGDEHIGNVYHIMEDDKGNLWFSTKGDGLVKAVPDEKTAGGFRFKRYLHNLSDLSSISGNDVYFTYQDEKKRIWVGTLDGGLNLLCEENGKSLLRINITDSRIILRMAFIWK